MRPKAYMNENIRKILELVRDQAVTVEEGEKLIMALDAGIDEQDSVYVEDIHTPWPDDDKLHVAAFIGKRLVKRESFFRRVMGENATFTLKLEGPARDVDCWGHLECGSIEGRASAGSHINCTGNIGGSVTAGSHIQCGQIGGKASAGSSINCEGDILGGASAGGSVRARNIEGKVSDSRSAARHAHERHRGWADEVKEDVRAAVNEIKSEDFWSDIKAAGEDIKNLRFIFDDFRWGKGHNGGAQNASDMPHVPWDEDGTIRVAAFKGKELLQSRDGLGSFELRIDSGLEIDNIVCFGDMSAQGIVCDSIRVGGSVTCGSVEGDLGAGGNVQCDSVEGDVRAGGYVQCDSIEGDVKAGGNVDCESACGDVSANGDIKCGSVEGDAKAGGNLECKDVGGDATAGGNITCGTIEGDATAKRGSISCGNVRGEAYGSRRQAETNDEDDEDEDEM